MSHSLATSLPGSSQFDIQFHSKGGNPEGILVRKTSLNSCKRLVIEQGKGVVISSSENKTYLYTKA
jgi:hypothetical protein